MFTDAVTVGLVEITEPGDVLVYLPYAIGLLQAYALAHAASPKRYRFLPLQFQRKPLEEAAVELASADIVGFSSYLWNYAYNLNLARQLKQRNPQQLIVFGGPHVPDVAADFLAAHPYVDICVHGEGEATFLRLLEAWPGNDWAALAGISYRDAAGRCVTLPKATRELQDLNAIPSPYLTGVFEPIMREHPHLAWAAIWETNRGCPFTCAFCDWGTINSKVLRFDSDRVRAEIEWFGSQGIHFVFSSDANFGMFPRDLEIARWMVESSQRYGFPKKVVTQMTKNQADRAFEAHRILSDGGLLGAATVSFQAVDATVLKAIRRENISLEVYKQLLKRFSQAGIATYTDILIGLPGETYDSFAEGLAALIAMGQHDELRFYYTYLLPNSEMARPDYRQRYGIQTLTVPFYSPYLAELRPDELGEEYEMVISTDAMPRRDWIRARTLAWGVEILYYRQLLQLPLLLLPALSGVSHRQIFQAYFEDPLEMRMTVLEELRQLLLKRAMAVSQGQPESLRVASPNTGQPAWIAIPDYVTAQLVIGERLTAFYQQSGWLLENLCRQGQPLPAGLLDEALRLARALFEARLSRQPFEQSLRYNLWGCYQQIRHGETPVLRPGDWRVVHRRDAEDRPQTLEFESVRLI